MWRSLWSRGLRRGSAASRLPGLRFRIPPRTWPSPVNAVSFQVEVSVTDRSFVQRSHTEKRRDTEGVCVCVIGCDQVQQ